MKVQYAILKQPINIGDLRLNGVKTLGAGNVKDVEKIELVENYLKVSRNNRVAIIPLSEVSYLLLAEEPVEKLKKQ